MKTKTIVLIVVSLIPLTAFSQPQPPQPPNPPNAPQPPRDREDRRPKVPVTFLGVDTSEVPSVLCDQLGLPKGFGLVVDYVVPDGPAAAAGVQQNDVLKMLNDQILTDPGQLSKLIRNYSEGTNVTLTVLRKGQEQKITVKLAKKEVPRRRAWMDNMRHMSHDWNFDIGDAGNMDDLKERMSELKERLGEQRGMIHDAVVRAQEEARRATDEARRNAERSIHTITRDNGALQRTTIDLNKAQIVLSDDKGELRIENKDGKKFLTAKDPQGKLLFSGPVETNEDLGKVPAEVRQRYEKLQEHDLRAVAPDDLRAESGNDNDEDDDDRDEDSASNVSYDQVCSQEAGHSAWEIHTVLL
jgi:serine protease Do